MGSGAKEMAREMGREVVAAAGEGLRNSMIQHVRSMARAVEREEKTFERLAGEITRNLREVADAHKISMSDLMTRYENEDVASQLYLTEWDDFNPSNLSFEKKNTGYYSISDGYCFMMPSRWTGSVTVKRDVAKNEIVFYKYSGDIKDDSIELMRICVVNKSGAIEKLNEGYIKIHETVQVEYLVKISDNKYEPLVPTESEVTYNFNLV
jgi:hypothetical protein